MKGFTPLFAYTTLATLFMPWAAEAVDSPFNGFYAGINAGFIQTQEKINHGVILNLGSIPIDSNRIEVLQQRYDNNNPSKPTDTAALGGLTLGYSQAVMPCWLLGLEGRLNFAHSNTTNAIQAYDGIFPVFSSQTTVKMKESYAILGKLGFLAGKSAQFYGLIGASWGHFQIHTDTNTGQRILGPGSPLFSGEHHFQSSEDTGGLLLGLGVEYWIGCGFSLGAEYNYTFYNTLDYPQDTSVAMYAESTPITGGSLVDLHKIKMHVGAFMLKASYYFDM